MKKFSIIKLIIGIIVVLDILMVITIRNEIFLTAAKKVLFKATTVATGTTGTCN